MQARMRGSCNCAVHTKTAAAAAANTWLHTLHTHTGGSSPLPQLLQLHTRENMLFLLAADPKFLCVCPVLQLTENRIEKN